MANQSHIIIARSVALAMVCVKATVINERDQFSGIS